MVAFIVIPLTIGVALRAWLTRTRSKAWFEGQFRPKFSPVTILALLAMLVLIFASRRKTSPAAISRIFDRDSNIDSGLLQLHSGVMDLCDCSRCNTRSLLPARLLVQAMFLNLPWRRTVALFGPGSGAALATVVGVLVEVPVMLSVCGVCNRTPHWFRSKRRRRVNGQAAHPVSVH